MHTINLVKKSALYFIGNISTRVLSATLIPVYAFFISAEDLGYFDISQTFLGILTPILLVAIWESILKFILSEDDTLTKYKIVSTSLLFSCIVSSFILIAIIPINLLFEIPVKYFNLIVMMILLNGLVYIWQNYARAFEESKLYVKAGIVSSIVHFFLVIILVVILNKGLLGLLLSFNMGQLATIIVIEKNLKIMKSFRAKNFDFFLLKRMLIFSMPLVLNLISAWLISGFGRIIITNYLGLDYNGFYSFANRFSFLIGTIGTVITMAFIEEAIIYNKSKKSGKEFGITIQKLFKVFQLLIILTFPSIVIFYEMISETEYYYSLIYVPGLLLCTVISIMATNFAAIFQAIGRTKVQFITTLFGGILTVIISLLTIDHFGVSGIIISQLIGALCMLFLRYFLVKKYVELSVSWRPIFLRSGVFILLALLCLKINIYFNAIIQLSFLLAVLYINKDLIMHYLRRLLRI